MIKPAVKKRLDQYESLARGLNKKIAPIAKTSVAVGVGLLAGIPVAEAATVYSGIQNVNLNFAGSAVQINFDIDGGGDDLFFRAYGFGGQPAFIARKIGGGDVTAFEGNASGAYIYPTPQTSAYVFGPANLWRSNGTQGSLQIAGYPGPQWGALAGGTTRFMGIRLSGSRHGWMRITKNSNASWTIVDWAYETTANANISPAATLPVEFSVFTASLKDQTVHLNWATATEQNNAGFELERSSNGRDFEKIAFIEGEGNSTQEQRYFYDDKAIRQRQTYFYRLKQIDYDGAYTYSELVSVEVKGDQGTKGVFSPNPSNGQLQLTYTAIQSSELTLSILDVSGKLLFEQQQLVVEGSNLLNFDLRRLSPGVYVAKLTADDQTEYQQLVIQ